VTYTVEAAAVLEDWSSELAVAEVIPALAAGLPPLASGWEYRTFRAGSAAANARVFFRTRVGAQ
jgi:hypothetical protein